MRKKTLFGIAMLIVSIPTFAGGFLTNTNQNVMFLRMLARDASTRIDAVYSNPAGLAFIEGGDGLHLSLNVQSAYQTRKITSTFAPFAYGVQNGGSDTKLFKGEASAPFIPSFLLDPPHSLGRAGRCLLIESVRGVVSKASTPAICGSHQEAAFQKETRQGCRGPADLQHLLDRIPRAGCD